MASASTDRSVSRSVVGVTRWLIGTAQLSYFTAIGDLKLQPILEVARIHAQATEEFPVISPEVLYGSNDLWSFSVGIRSVIGSWHSRMGRYGAARIHDQEHH